MNNFSIESRVFALARPNPVAAKYTDTMQVWNWTITLGLAVLGLSLTTVNARAQVNGVGAKPYLGWSTYSEQCRRAR